MINSPVMFKKNIKEALLNKQLQKNLNKALSHSLIVYNQLKNSYGNNWDLMREKANKIKAHTIEHLYDYLTIFENNALKNGFKVIWAKNSEDACNSIFQIINNKNGKRIVKSKSMTSEEIGLNHFLEKNKIEVIETDLGEYIIQLAKEPPSHIIVPAIHKSKEEIGKLFSEKFSVEYTSDPTKLTKIARSILREKFLNADIGISGVNFAIAETGSIVIIENEGNGRLSNSSPKTHIAIMGMEKVIPSLLDFDVFIKLLPASATGQKITSYISMINSIGNASKALPEDIYIIILDNGRSELISNEKYKSALYCIRCGSCMNICPIYNKIGGQAYGTVYPGPIGSVLTPNYLNKKIAKNLPYASTLCGSCTEICPVKIDLHHKLLHLRNDIVESNNTNRFETILFRLFRVIVKKYSIYNTLTLFAKSFQFLIKSKNGFIRIPLYKKSKYYPSFKRNSFHKWWKDNNN